MAHYAFLDENNVVTEVITGIDESELIEGLDPDGNGPGESFARRIFNGEQAVKEAQDTVNAIEKEIDSIQTGIDAKEVRIQNEVTIPLRKFEDAILALQEKIQTNFDDPIAKFQAKASILSNDLILINKATEAINTKYDAQQEALTKISELNQDLITQEKQRISLADALSQGDISAAAQIAQDIRSAAAEKTASGSGDFLNIAKEQELANLRSASGQTRLQIEQRQFEISQEIYSLEQGRALLEADIARIKKDDILPLENLRKDLLLFIRDKEDDIYTITNGTLLVAQQTLKTKQDNLIKIEEEKQAELDKLNKLELKWIEVQGEIAGAEAATIDLQGAVTEAIRLATELKRIFGSMPNFKNIVPGESTTTKDTPCPPGSKMNDKGECVKLTVAETAANNAVIASVAVDAEAEAAAAAAAEADAIAEAAAAAADALTQAALDAQAVLDALAIEVAALEAGLKVTHNTTAVKQAITIARAAGAIKGERIYGSSGGMVPKYFVAGGYARGTDTVPAMLTPGEFVMSKYAVDSYGTNKMNAINNGSYGGEKVYNYNLNVNVKSDANPEDIARVVMTQIRQVDSQRIRTQR